VKIHLLTPGEKKLIQNPTKADVVFEVHIQNLSNWTEKFKVYWYVYSSVVHLILLIHCMYENQMPEILANSGNKTMRWR